MRYKVVGNPDDILLHEFDNLQEAMTWVERYSATENAGGYDNITLKDEKGTTRIIFDRDNIDD